ncbi:MAG TPA: VOC family protein [Dehalococcoidia bacterium]
MGSSLDHVAIGVADLDGGVAMLTSTFGMVLKRMGTHVASGGRIAFLADPASGMKLELIETPDRQTGFMHVAFRVDDVAAEHARLTSAGFETVRGPFRLEPARADTALLRDPSGLEVQIIRYDTDSPDL